MVRSHRAEFDNLRTAIIWALNQQDGTRPLRIIVALEGYLDSRLNEREVRPWVEAALALAPNAPPLLRAGAYWRFVTYAVHTGDVAAALTSAQEQLVQAKLTGDPRAIGHALLSVGWAWEMRGEPERRLEALEARSPICGSLTALTLLPSGCHCWGSTALTPVGLPSHNSCSMRR